ncbi:hypothetical protein LCGC14_0718160 [marine sediment metagenome]|uniref:Uncharacterized protein n=1 Tax=marine sediment metagenome TaxID=412755 RepID=A0A0F9QHH0_9ZZZZ
MTLLSVVYRLTVFEADSDSVPLTPAAGAPHSQEFKVISSGSVGGAFQPYITAAPVGKKDSFDPVTKNYTIGAIRIMLGDPKVGGVQLNRWVSAFVGDDLGAIKMKGLRAFIEESVDGGVTFSPFYVGDIKEFTLQNKVEWRIVIREDTDVQKSIKVFTGEPSASLLSGPDAYGNRRQMLPWGPDVLAQTGYGALKALPPPSGEWKLSRSPRNRIIEIDKDAGVNRIPGVILVSKPLLNQTPEIDDDDATKKETEGRIGPIVRVISGATVGRFYLTYLEVFADQNQLMMGYPISCDRLLLEPIEVGAFEHQPLSAITVGNNVIFQILTTEPPSEKFPTLINNVHPFVLLRDVIQGKWSALNPTTGQALFEGKVDIDETVFDGFIADKQFKNSRWRRTEEMEMKKFIKEFLQQYNLGYRMEPTASAGRAFSKFVPFSMDLPTTIGSVPTITTQEVRSTSPVSWKPGQNFLRFEMTFYEERVSDIADIRDGGDEGQSPYEGPDNPTLIKETPITDTIIQLGNLFGGDGVFKQNATGLRYFPSEIFVDLEFVNGIDLNFYRERMVRRLANKLQRENEFRFSRGPATIDLELERTGSTNDLKLGDFRILDVDFIPDPFTHVRGGARIVQCIEKSENGPTINFRFADSGQNVQRSAPVVNAFSQISATNTASGTIQTVKRERVETWFAITDQSTATRPAETSSLWEYQNSVIIPAGTTQSVAIGELPDGGRIWVRARSRVPSDEDLQLPSDFAFPPAHFDMGAALAAPTNLIISEITETTAKASWTPADVDVQTEVRLKPASSASFQRVAILYPGTNQYPLGGLSFAGSENPYTLGVRHVSAWRMAAGSEVTKTFSTVAGKPKCPTPRGIIFSLTGGIEDDQFRPLY